MKNTIIAVIVVILLVLGFWWYKTQNAEPALETVPQEDGLNVDVSGEVQGDTWEATGKDGSADEAAQ